MDTLWESLEELLDAEANPNYEVEYSVRRGPRSHAWIYILSIPLIGRGADTQVGRAWDICRQQATAKQTNLALVTNIVSRKTSVRSLPQMVLTLYSGPKRYDYSEEKDDWFYSRDGVALSDLLDNEISQIMGRRVELGIQNVSEHVN